MEAVTIIKEALLLNATERAKIADCILTSLDAPDKAIDKQWKDEVESRISAYKSGDLTSISLADIFLKDFHTE